MELQTAVIRHPSEEKRAEFVREHDRIIEARAQGIMDQETAERKLTEIGGGEQGFALMGFLPAGATQGPIYNESGEVVGEVVAGDLLVPFEIWNQRYEGEITR